MCEACVGPWCSVFVYRSRILTALSLTALEGDRNIRRILSLTGKVLLYLKMLTAVNGQAHKQLHGVWKLFCDIFIYWKRLFTVYKHFRILLTLAHTMSFLSLNWVWPHDTKCSKYLKLCTLRGSGLLRTTCMPLIALVTL